MKAKIKIIRFISIALAITFTLFTACGKSSQNPGVKQQSAKSESQSNTSKVPSELINLEKNIEMIFITLDGPAVQVKEDAKQGSQGTSSGQEKQGTKGQQDSQSEQQGQGQQQSQRTSTTRPPQQPQDQMDKVTPIVNKMHFQWNNLMPIALKKGAKKNLIDNFDNELNKLSQTITNKNKINTLMAANHLYSYIPELYLLFEKSTSPEIKRMRYYSRNAILNSLTANWTQVDSDITKLKDIWSMQKNALKNEQQDLAGKLDVSIFELEKVTKQRSQPITDIKGRITFSNIELLEKSKNSESNKGTQSGNGQSGNQSSVAQSSSQKSGESRSGGSQSSVYSYMKQLFDKLLKK